MAKLSSGLGKVGAAHVMAGLALSLLALAQPARASGPTERIQQVFPHPTDPNLITVRYGMASSGYLYSKDGGKTFRAGCSAMAWPGAEESQRVKSITLRSIASTTANAMDSEGRVLFSQYHYLYADDGTGCTWTQERSFENRWAFGMQADPVTPGVVWAAITDSTEGVADPVAKLEIARRDAAGTWTTVAPLMPPIESAVLYDGNLLATQREGKLRLYVTANIGETLTTQPTYVQHVFVSDDEGKTWQDIRLPAALESLWLLAVDPGNADRLVGVIWRDGLADELYLSEDAGKTFARYPGSEQLLRAVSGSTFDARGRFLVSDQGDGPDADVGGGVFVADKLGAPLKRAEGTAYADCIHYRALTDTLYLCSYDKLSTVDPETFAAKEVVRMETVAGVLECPGRDVVAECKEQFNEGPSWCCTGHFPFTPFCAAYDVTRRPDGRPVFCGLSGREYERPGSTQAGADAGAPLASVDQPRTDPPAGQVRAASAGGCSVGASSGAGLLSALLTGLTLAVAARSRARSRRRTH